MENASKALIIAGAILLSILIIGVGIFIFTSSQGMIDESLQSMSTQEVQAFNSQFTSYQGDELTGSNVKALLTVLAGNLGTYADEPSKVPSVNGTNVINTGNAVYNNTNQANNYINAINALRNAVINKNTYKVVMNFGTNGVITEIVITNATV